MTRGLDERSDAYHDIETGFANVHILPAHCVAVAVLLSLSNIVGIL